MPATILRARCRRFLDWGAALSQTVKTVAREKRCAIRDAEASENVKIDRSPNEPTGRPSIVATIPRNVLDQQYVVVIAPPAPAEHILREAEIVGQVERSNTLVEQLSELLLRPARATLSPRRSGTQRQRALAPRSRCRNGRQGPAPRRLAEASMRVPHAVGVPTPGKQHASALVQGERQILRRPPSEDGRGQRRPNRQAADWILAGRAAEGLAWLRTLAARQASGPRFSEESPALASSLLPPCLLSATVLEPAADPATPQRPSQHLDARGDAEVPHAVIGEI